MLTIVRSLLSLLQPPYGWVLLILLAFPFWVLFFGVFMSRWSQDTEGSQPPASPRSNGLKGERDLARYAALLTAIWLLIVAFKVYQQYFTFHPVQYSELGAFDLSLGLFCLASWAGILMLRTQERLQQDGRSQAPDQAGPS